MGLAEESHGWYWSVTCEVVCWPAVHILLRCPYLRLLVNVASVDGCQRVRLCCSRYPAVTCDLERHRYKTDFTSEYSEYLRLHKNISERMKTFSALSDRLKQATQHSPEYEVSTTVCVLSILLTMHMITVTLSHTTRSRGTLQLNMQQAHWIQCQNWWAIGWRKSLKTQLACVAQRAKVGSLLRPAAYTVMNLS